MRVTIYKEGVGRFSVLITRRREGKKSVRLPSGMTPEELSSAVRDKLQQWELEEPVQLPV